MLRGGGCWEGGRVLRGREGVEREGGCWGREGVGRDGECWGGR